MPPGTSLQCTIIGGIDPISTTAGSSGNAGAKRSHVAALVLFLLLAVAHTWPLATAPARLSRNDNADTILNEWIIGWVAHQAPRHPGRIFDGNIFYPDAATLTYSEPLLIPAALGAPLAWTGASPVLVYNLLVIAGLTLTAWAAWLLLVRWTNDSVAAACGAVVIAFNAHTLTRLPQLQALHVEFLPLALLALDRVLVESGDAARKQAVWLGVSVALQGLTSLYSLVFTVTALVAGWVVRVEDWPRPGRLGGAARALLAAAVAVAVLAPVLWPYLGLHAVRRLDEVGLYSATWKSYLMTPARIHFARWSAGFFSGDTALFPGVAAIALAAVAVATGVAIRDRRARMGLAIAAAGFALSFGPALPGYATLYALLWPLQGIRNAARFGYLVTVGLAILCAFGVAELRRRRPAGSLAAAVLLVAAVNIDAFAAPLSLVDAERISPVHRRLLRTDAIVAEFPFYPPQRMFRQAPYLLHSMQHWRPMLNGYSGLAPASYAEHSRELAGFPNAAAIDALRRIGVTHVFVHDRALRDWTDNETADAVMNTGALRLLARDADVALYELARP